MEIRSIDAFLSYWARIRERTRKVVACVPPEKLEWTPAEGRFSAGDIVRHLAASERYMFVENACGRPSRYPGHGRELADGRDEVLAYLDRCHAEAVEILGGLGEPDLQEKCVTPGGSPIAAWKWLRAMVEHEIHHRGQIFLYLGLLGLSAPPLFGLTEEEVKERSRA